MPALLPPEVLVRAAGTGAGAGAGAGTMVGGLVATVDFPVGGTFFGALYGALIGITVGLLTGLVIVGCRAVTASSWALRGSSAAASGSAVTAAFGVGVIPLQPGWAEPVLISGCVLFAGAVGPSVLKGWQPITVGQRLGRRDPAQIVRAFVVGGAIAGGSIGAAAGLIIGISTYLPTFPFAIIEGGVLGSVSGVVLALVLAVATLCVAGLSR